MICSLCVEYCHSEPNCYPQNNGALAAELMNSHARMATVGLEGGVARGIPLCGLKHFTRTFCHDHRFITASNCVRGSLYKPEPKDDADDHDKHARASCHGGDESTPVTLRPRLGLGFHLDLVLEAVEGDIG